MTSSSPTVPRRPLLALLAFLAFISFTPGRVGRAHADRAIGFQIAAALTALVGVIARAGGLELIGASIVVAAVLLLGLYQVFMRAGSQDTPSGPGTAPPPTLRSGATGGDSTRTSPA